MSSIDRVIEKIPDPIKESFQPSTNPALHGSAKLYIGEVFFGVAYKEGRPVAYQAMKNGGDNHYDIEGNIHDNFIKLCHYWKLREIRGL